MAGEGQASGVKSPEEKNWLEHACTYVNNYINPKGSWGLVS